MAAGRPSTYDPQFCVDIVAYFDKEPFETITLEDGKTVRQPVKLPTLNAFAHSLGVHRDTLHAWSQTHPDFSDAMKMAKALQEDILMQNGLFGAYDKTFAIFTAKNICGWRDKTEQELTGPNGGPVQVTRIERVIVDPDV